MLAKVETECTCSHKVTVRSTVCGVNGWFTALPDSASFYSTDLAPGKLYCMAPFFTIAHLHYLTSSSQNKGSPVCFLRVLFLQIFAIFTFELRFS